ncbi:MAG TPA: phage replisome organizer N-terminal domain-containing protein, partial [Dissulfurispiraceae bacterium]|nr:phage replisome organizer N-terminal domain-containing protein [Dissulfurispiraceae bacterium]
MATNPSMPWVKAYVEMLDDVKLSRLTDAQCWRFMQLILLAGECDAEGALVTGDSPMTHEDIAWRLRKDIETVSQDMSFLVKIGLLDFDDGVYIVRKFADRQGPTQSEKREMWRKRQQDRRSRLKTAKNAPENGESHAGVTGDANESHAPRLRVRVREDKEEEKRVKHPEKPVVTNETNAPPPRSGIPYLYPMDTLSGIEERDGDGDRYRDGNGDRGIETPADLPQPWPCQGQPEPVSELSPVPPSSPQASKPAQKTRKLKPGTVPKSELDPIVTALSTVTGRDLKLNYGRMAREAKDLHTAGYSADDVLLAFGDAGPWYQRDWR